MLRLNLRRILNLKGITTHNRYLTRLGYSRSYSSDVLNGYVRSVSFEKLEQFCIDFDCTPNDLFDFRPSKENGLPAGHALHSLTKTDNAEEVHKLLNNLPASKIDRLYEILKSEGTGKA